MRLLSAADITAGVSLIGLIDAMQDAFLDISTGQSRFSERQFMPMGDGTGISMGATSDTLGMVTKVVSVMPGNPLKNLPGTLGSVLLMDAGTGQPLSLMEGTCLTALRTAAVAGCATRLLARQDARVGLLAGCGTQAAVQIHALDQVRDLSEIHVYGARPESAIQFIDRHQSDTRARLRPVTDLSESVSGADVIVAATSSEEPVFDADALSPGVHISSVGSFREGMCEIDPQLASRSHIFVESRASARAEAGELISACEDDLTRPQDWVELGEVINQAARGRTVVDEITWFKSVGHAVFDLHAARHIFDRCSEQSLGQIWQA